MGSCRTGYTADCPVCCLRDISDAKVAAVTAEVVEFGEIGSCEASAEDDADADEETAVRRKDRAEGAALAGFAARVDGLNAVVDGT